jgi:hypothetical protein
MNPPLAPRLRSLIGVDQLGRVLLLGAAIALWTPLHGCASTESTASQEAGPPPEGFETWEEYGKAKDREYEEFERNKRAHEMSRPRVPGGPR